MSTWQEWVELHSEIFAMATDQDRKTLARWAEMFHSAGFDPVEMVEASRGVSMSDPPRWRAEIPSRLTAFVRHKRMQSSLRESNPDEDVDVFTCEDCDGSGTISVPNETIPGGCRFDCWYWVSVACGCSVGSNLWEQRRQRTNGRFITIHQYESRFPRWREKVRAFHDYLKKRASIDEENTRLDKSLGPLAWRRAIQAAEGTPNG